MSSRGGCPAMPGFWSSGCPHLRSGSHRARKFPLEFRTGCQARRAQSDPCSRRGRDRPGSDAGPERAWPSSYWKAWGPVRGSTIELPSRGRCPIRIPMRRDRASSRLRLRQIRAGRRSRDSAPPSTNGQRMTPDSGHCAGTVRASRGPVSRRTKPPTVRFRCLRVRPATLAPKIRELVCAHGREVRPKAPTRRFAIHRMPRGASDLANTATRSSAARRGAAT